MRCLPNGSSPHTTLALATEATPQNPKILTKIIILFTHKIKHLRKKLTN